MRRFSNQCGMALIACVLAVSSGTSLCGQTAARPRAVELLEWWNRIGNKLIDMAKDFPEDKYDFKVQKDERTFAQNLLHVAAIDYLLIGKVSGSKVGPDFGKDIENPPREVYKTKADVVKLLEQAVADGASVIKQQGDTGLDKTREFGWETGQHVVRKSYIWMTASSTARNISASLWFTIARTIWCRRNPGLNPNCSRYEM